MVPLSDVDPAIARDRPQNKSHRVEQRPPFEYIALFLQGGGALGAYQAGAYQALAEADLHPYWIAVISIGALNAALIAGYRPDARVDILRLQCTHWPVASRKSRLVHAVTTPTRSWRRRDRGQQKA